jgi:hypothetical protein
VVIGGTDRSGMNKSRVATWVVAAALAAGSGMALAETSPDDPEIDPAAETTTTTEAPTTTTVAEPTTTTTVEENDGDVERDETDGDAATKEHPDNHGKVVSEAARDHSHDEQFGNHGKYVSSVARGDKGERDGGGEAKGKNKADKPADADDDD